MTVTKIASHTSNSQHSNHVSTGMYLSFMGFNRKWNMTRKFEDFLEQRKILSSGSKIKFDRATASATKKYVPNYYVISIKKLKC